MIGVGMLETHAGVAARVWCSDCEQFVCDPVFLRDVTEEQLAAGTDGISVAIALHALEHGTTPSPPGIGLV